VAIAASMMLQVNEPPAGLPVAFAFFEDVPQTMSGEGSTEISHGQGWTGSAAPVAGMFLAASP
jgi:hypothetical protein